jgi:hypothetical protein
MGAVLAMQPTPRQSAETERQLQTMLLAVMALLQREQRVTYRTLTYQMQSYLTDRHCRKHTLKFNETKSPSISLDKKQP